MRIYKNNEKGFTLVEIIVVISIIALLSGIGAVSYKKTIDRAEESACIVNREQIESIFMSYLIENPDATWAGAFAGHYDMGNDISEITCPDGGTYYVDAEGHLMCTLHGGNEEDAEKMKNATPTPTPESTSNGGGSPVNPITDAPTSSNDTTPKPTAISIPTASNATSTPTPTPVVTPEPTQGTTTVPGTTIQATTNYWPQSGDMTITSGDVFEYNGEYYVVTQGGSLNASQIASGPGNISGIQKLTGVIRDYSNTNAIKNVSKGDICLVNGQYMMYTSNNKWAYHPYYASYQWFTIPNN